MTKRRPLLETVFLSFVLTVFLSIFAVSARAGDEPIHATAKKQVWKRKIQQLELYGDVAIHQPGATLLADFAVLDQNKRTIDAKGNCVLLSGETTIFGDEMHMSQETHTGIVLNGKVVNSRFTLTGEKLFRLSETEYRSLQANYTTCHDCARSWTIYSRDLRMEVEGYATMRDVVVKVKDAPVFWLPYLIIPTKSKRQTGFLFPRFGASTFDGFVFVQPFFWAISRSTDMTIGLGDYSLRGRRAEWEFRYALGNRSDGTFNIFYLNDRGKQPYRPDRAAFDTKIRQQFPWKIDGKLRFTEVTDNKYPILVGDVPGRGELVITSKAMLSKSSSNLSAYVETRRYRHLLNRGLVGFDSSTVQVAPTAVLTTNDQMIAATRVGAGLTLGVTRFTRNKGRFDYNDPNQRTGTYQPGIDPLREADRFLISPTLATSYRVFDVIKLAPSMNYKLFKYDFGPIAQPLSRGYLQTQIELQTQLEKIYDNDNEYIPRSKHLIRPLLRYSFIPRWTVSEPDHPFLTQIRARDGYNFDNYDRVPLDNSPTQINYFVPLGNSLTYGYTTQLIRRKGALDKEGASYQNSVEWQLGQTYNFNELKKPSDKRQPYSRLFSNLMFGFDDFASTTNYYYYPYVNPGSAHAVSTSATYILERGIHQNVLVYDRSLTMAYSFNRLNAKTSTVSGTLTFSINDYILPSYSLIYDLVTKKQMRTAAALAFQSPSRCWRLSLAFSQAIDRPGVSWAPDFSINLTGDGFFGAKTASASGATSSPR